MNVKINEVRRSQFNEIAERIEEDPDTKVQVTVYYDGNNLFGSLMIESAISRLCKKALVIATEVITRG